MGVGGWGLRVEGEGFGVFKPHGDVRGGPFSSAIEIFKFPGNSEVHQPIAKVND